MASFSPVPMIAAGMAASRISPVRGGGGGKPPEDDFDLGLSKMFLWMGLVFCAFIGAAMLVSHYEEEQPAYVVKGTIHGYHYERHNKKDMVFVEILQSDGNVRSYNTGKKKNQCNFNTLGSEANVQVTPSYNSLLNRTVHDSRIMFVPCI